MTIPAERPIRTALRALHIAAASVLVGGHFFEIPAERLAGPLLATVGTGILFVLFESLAVPGWLLEGRGLVTLAKIALLLLVPILWEARLAILFAVIALGVVGAHMPSKYRYYSVRTGRVERHMKKG